MTGRAAAAATADGVVAGGAAAIGRCIACIACILSFHFHSRGISATKNTRHLLRVQQQHQPLQQC